MATYVNDLRLKEIATGDESGTWGDTTNTNLELIAEAFSYGTEAITTNADTHTTTIADGATDPGRSMYLKYTGTLDSACTITIGPNTVSKMWFIENATSGSQNIIISQGSGANITIPPGDVKVVYTDGAGSGAAVVDAFASLSVVDLKVQDDLTVTDDLIVNGDIDLEGNMDVNGSLETDALSLNGTTVTSTAAEINLLDGSSANTVVNSKAVIYGSSGEVAGTLSTAAQPNITSLGTLTALTGGTGDLNWDSGTLFVDSSANKVTIGSTANLGTALLNVAGGIDVADSDYPYLKLKLGSNESIVEAVGQFQNMTVGGTGANGYLRFKTADTERMRIDSSGRVAIGTSSIITDTIFALHEGNVDLEFSLDNAVANTARIFAFDRGTTTHKNLQLRANQTEFYSGSSEAMRIDSSGNVGIGTASPQNILHTDSASTGEVVGLALSNSNTSFSANEAVSIKFGVGSATALAHGKILVANTDSGFGSNGYMSFYTRGSDSVTERMRIDSSGNVGIGNSSPQQKLTVGDGADTEIISIFAGSGAASGIHFTDTNTSGDDFQGFVTYDHTADALRFGTAEAERMRIDSSGNVGIGTSSVTNNTNRTTLGLQGAWGGQLDIMVGSTVHAQFGTDNFSSGQSCRIQSQDGIVFKAGGSSERMRIDSSGRLLVGIAGTSDSDFGLFNVAVAGASTGRFHIGYGSNGDNYYTVGSSGKHIFRQDTSEKMRINSDGRVWIGSSNVTQLGSHLVVVDDNDVFGVLASTVSAGVVLQTNKGGANGTDSTTTYLSMQRPDGTVRGTINATGTSGVVYNTTSDYRLKENVRPIQNGLERLNQLNPVKFDWKEDGTSSEGFIAHEVQEIFSDAVSGEKDGEKMQGVDYGRITPLLVKAIQEQQTQIEALQSEINELKNS